MISPLANFIPAATQYPKLCHQRDSFTLCIFNQMDALPPFEDEDDAEDAVEDAEGRRKRKRRRILSMSDVVGMAEERPWSNSKAVGVLLKRRIWRGGFCKVERSMNFRRICLLSVVSAILWRQTTEIGASRGLADGSDVRDRRPSSFHIYWKRDLWPGRLPHCDPT